ncbi:unnamed protein product [Staurois parvus]|uniref:Uncharacterized protein n=1 Tax=Staurois parvus TaxID=386267 RepID=A0ABN9GXL9_9NEOB|nr:unnamed protein product [Staurois parvus]
MVRINPNSSAHSGELDHCNLTIGQEQGRTDNSLSPRAIGDHGARVLAQTQKSL